MAKDRVRLQEKAQAKEGEREQVLSREIQVSELVPGRKSISHHVPFRHIN